MLGCHGCQEFLLDYLYELLEESEEQALRAHLVDCPACQQALLTAQEQQRLLARAACRSFPQVQFHPPADQPIAGQPPVSIPIPRKVARSRPAWARWAVAAAIVLALSSLSWPLYQAHQQYTAAEQALLAHDQSVAEARREAQTALADLQAAVRQRDRVLAELEKQTRERELRLLVSGPRSIEAGAPAEFHVEARDLTGQLADAEVVASLAPSGPMSRAVPGGLPAPSNKKTAGVELDISTMGPGQYKIRIPPTVRLQPGQSLDMLVSARKKVAGGDKERGVPGISVAGSIQLTAPRYLTHLTTDKPLYQPGETVRFRSLTLQRDRLTPPEQDFQLHYQLTSPTGAVRTVAQGNTQLIQQGRGDSPVIGPDGKPLRGIGAGEFLLEPAAPGGEYTLTVSDSSNRFPPVSRKFLVNAYQKPRLDKKLDFNRSSYGPRDEVQARVVARRADGAALDDQMVEAVVTVDGQQIGRDGRLSTTPLRLRTDDQGAALVRFRLPAQIDRGEVSLAVTFKDADVTETIVRPVPVILNKLLTEFYPEGGDLVAGLVNRVYFQARTPLGKPAQLTGELLEEGQPTGIRVATLHDDQQPGVNQGQGVFSFTPRAGKTYQVRITSPTGITAPVALPVVQPDGVVLSVPGGVFDPKAPLRVQVHSTRPRSLLVGAYCRGQLLDTVQLPPGQTEAILRPSDSAGGVCRITVFEELPGQGTQKSLRPRAERLVYRQPAHRLDVSIEPDQQCYSPGQRVGLSLGVADETGESASAVALVAVVDGSVLNLADERTARSLPTHFLLTSEVRRADDLEHADFLLSNQPKAAEALDLLLGTQGWRRFAEQNPSDFIRRLQQEQQQQPNDSERRRDAEDGERLLVLLGQGTPQTTDLEQATLRSIEEQFNKQFETLEQKHRQASLVLQKAAEGDEYQAAVQVLARFDDQWRQFRGTGLPLLGLALIALALGGLAAAARRRPTIAWACGLTAAAGLFLLSTWPGSNAHNQLREREESLARLEKEWIEPNRELGDRRAIALLGRGVGGFGGLGGPQMGEMACPDGPAAPAEAEKAGAPPALAMRRMAPRAAANNLEQGDGLMLERRQERLLRDAQQRLRPRDLAAGKPDAARNAFAGEGRAGRGPGIANMPVPPAPGRPRFPGMPGLADREMALPPLVVREYAHVRPQADSEVRSDFTETVFWHPVLVLNGGKGKVSFELPDSVTSFQALVSAHSLDGRLGSATRQIESRLPFNLAPRVPIEVTATDRIDVPVAISNTSHEPLAVDVRLNELRGLKLDSESSSTRLQIPAQGRGRRLFSLRPTLTVGQASIEVNGTAGRYSDAIRESFRVVPDGFPVTEAISDLLEGSATHRIRIPQWLPGTLSLRVEVYPSTLADLQKGLAGLLAEPNGCFEQSSTANYPNVLVLDYLRATRQADPELERKTRDLLERGYHKLTSFECLEPSSNKRRGYEWFGGQAAPHEALTAYGLLQFRDMARVHPVDAAMLERTRAYLLSQRDGKGGFQRNERALDTFGRAPQDVTNAYIVWALTESSAEDALTEELTALAAQAETATDPYFLALVALGQANRGRVAEARKILDRLLKMQKPDGHLEAATSITASSGRDLHIETTALSLLGWLKVDRGSYAQAVRLAIGWLGKQRGGSGTFGSTQATILALKALIAHAVQEQKPAQAGELRLYVGEQLAGQTRFAAGVQGTIMVDLPDAEKLLQPGENTLRVEITGKANHYPHTLSWTYRTAKPLNRASVPVTLTTRLARSELREGEAVRLQVQVRNTSGKDQGMAVAVIGLPGGLIVPEDLKQLRDYCRLPEQGGRPQLGAFELRGRELVLYWRDLAKDQFIDLPIGVIARVPGSYRGPASRAYLYYNADDKHWVDPLEVSIAE